MVALSMPPFIPPPTLCALLQDFALLLSHIPRSNCTDCYAQKKFVSCRPPFSFLQVFLSFAVGAHNPRTEFCTSLRFLGVIQRCGRLSMRTVACFLAFVALMASFSGAHANQGHGRVGIHSALDGRWPDLVGRDAEEAKTIILNERPALNVQILSSDMMMTMDYNTNRVRIIVNDERKVVRCPTIG